MKAASAVNIKPRPLDGYFFEDYRQGQHYRHATPRTISAGDVALYIALTGARQPLHCARTVAQSLGYENCPVDDLLLFNIAFGRWPLFAAGVCRRHNSRRNRNYW